MCDAILAETHAMPSGINPHHCCSAMKLTILAKPLYNKFQRVTDNSLCYLMLRSARHMKSIMKSDSNSSWIAG